MVDGIIAGMRLAEKSLSHDANAKRIVPPWCVEDPRAKRLKEPRVSRLKKIFGGVKGHVEATSSRSLKHHRLLLKIWDVTLIMSPASKHQAPS